MASKTQGEILELIDISTKRQIAKKPLAAISFLPRAGERIFLPQGADKWKSYTVVNVEYFLAETTSGVPTTTGRGIVVYVEEST